MAMARKGAISVRQAQDRILAGVLTPRSQEVSLENAIGRIVNEPLVAKLTQPPFAASAMDGYGVRADDVATLPVRLEVIGRCGAGHSFDGRVGSREAVRIFTGAPVPEGADAIVIQENVRVVDERTVEVISGEVKASHIRPRAGDFSKNETLIQQGETLSSRHVTLAAAMGFGTVRVARAPVVAILSTGDELVAAGEVPGPNQIIASNGVGICALVRGAGGEARLLGIAQDTRESLKAKIESAAGADILVTIGGASVGDHDLVGPVLAELGMSLDFWKVAMRPGKPVMFGKLNQLRVIGVPGNPVSALICARVFVVPLIRAMLGVLPAVDFRTASVSLSEPMSENGPREHFARGLISTDETGKRRVTPMPDQDSSLLVPLVASNCLIIRAPEAPAAATGENVTVMLLDF